MLFWIEGLGFRASGFEGFWGSLNWILELQSLITCRAVSAGIPELDRLVVSLMQLPASDGYGLSL